MQKNALCSIFLFKNYILLFFCLLLLNLYISLALDRVAADSDDLMVFLPFPCQVTARNHIFRVFVYVVNAKFSFRQPLDKINFLK